MDPFGVLKLSRQALANFENIVELISVKSIAKNVQKLINHTSYFQYRCYGSMMFGGNPTYATWLSRDGMPQTYWGGATSRRYGYCACGEKGTL